MITVYSDKHRLRDAKTELSEGQLVRPFERPERALMILDRIRAVSLGEVIEPQEYGMETVLKLHDANYVSFLESAWEEWSGAGKAGEAIATCWPARRMAQRCPSDIDGKLGYYALAAETAISKGTWEASVAAKDVALTGAELLNGGERAVFSLCRPPGHHAAKDMYGGYCFLNNAAIAAQSLRDLGASRVAILDVDYHHGNGTQDIFYDRSDVLFLSLHADPMTDFPHFLGYADEAGDGSGEGYNVNYPLPQGTTFTNWREALRDALARIRSFSPEAVVVSLGADTYKLDPISKFLLESEDFLTYGADIAGLSLPTLFVMEGGYAISDLGINTVNVLMGFEAA